MKTALIVSVRVSGPHQFGWTWRTEDGAAQSKQTFRYYHDCREDARKAGYACRFAGTAESPPQASRVPESAPVPCVNANVSRAGGTAGARREDSR